MKNLIDIKYWVFDLDNVVYENQSKVFAEVDKNMSAFISKKLNVDLVEAKQIQKKYFYEYGTTLAGLMKNEGVDPHAFLEFVHNIDISWLPKNLKLREELIKLNEKKFIFSNGSHAHIINVTKQLGIDGLFDSAHDIVDSEFIPKPHMAAYKKMIKKFNIDPKKSIFIEDIAHNLEAAKELGMKTCWLENDESFAKKDANKLYIDYKIKSLPSFLQKINILKAT